MQIIRAYRFGRKSVWDITVHQKHFDGSFDMRDHFVVDRASLLPITMESQRGKDPAEKGWHRVTLRYTNTGVTGRKETASGVSNIDVPLEGPTWDGNLWGVTFAALPLRAGGSYRLPNWQYDKGRGTFIVNAKGLETIATPAGKVAAWAVDAGDDPAHLIRYYIARNLPMELAYRAGPFEQRVGGNCSSIGR